MDMIELPSEKPKPDNEENKNNDNGKDYSNAYTDMDCEAMTEDINHLKSANPEVYQKLQKMDITAAAGYRTEDTVSFSPYYTASGKHKINSDDIVSVESQHGARYVLGLCRQQ